MTVPLDMAEPPRALGMPCDSADQCQSHECSAGMCACAKTVCGGACVDLDSDSASCGACGHSCGGDPCQAGHCAIATVDDKETYLFTLAVTDHYAFMRTQEDEIVRLDIASGGRTIIEPQTPIQRTLAPPGLASIVVDDKNVYWTKIASGEIMKASFDADTGTLLASDQHQPYSIAVDGTNVYWLNMYEPMVMKTPRDGGAVTMVAGKAPDKDFLGNCIASDGNTVFALFGPDAPLWQAPVAGGQWVKLSDDLAEIAQFALYMGNIYFAKSTAIAKVSTSGGQVTKLADTMVTYDGGLTSDGSNVYFSDGNQFNGMVASVPVNGGAVTVLAKGLQMPTAVAVNATHVFWVERDQLEHTYLKRIAKP
jgi:hypothetical protein